jgi:pseudouridine-5'-phosphate glycosidase
MLRNNQIKYTEKVVLALRLGSPILALESAVITHGLPRPKNLELAQALETEALRLGVTPATIALLDGKVCVGLEPDELERLSFCVARKISRRDFGIALARKEAGGTTVAATLIAACTAGIGVFTTGGIGGVHRDAPYDVSADLPELARSRMIVVCAGAKAILDLRATLEYLETAGVPVIGYRTDEFPAFYSVESGLPVDARADSAEEIVAIAHAQWRMGLTGAVLVVVPPPAEAAIPAELVEREIQSALKEARTQDIRGARVTPFLLSRVAELSGGSSLTANLALLRQNTRVGAQIAAALATHKGTVLA